nr:pilin [Suttonella ornithocola]
MVRSQVTRAMGEAGNLKTVVETCTLDGKKEVGADDGKCQIGATGSSILNGAAQDGTTIETGTGVPQVTLPQNAGDTGTIVATFGNKAATKIDAQTLTWTRSADGTWTCKTSVDVKFAPAGCPHSN